MGFEGQSPGSSAYSKAFKARKKTCPKINSGLFYTTQVRQNKQIAISKNTLKNCWLVKIS